MFSRFAGVLLLLMCSANVSFAEEYSVSFEQGFQDFQFQDYDLAKDTFEQLIQEGNADFNVHYYLGLTYKELKQYDLALVHLKQAKTGGFDGLASDIAEVYMLSGQPEKALPFYHDQYLEHITEAKYGLKYASVLNAVGESSKALGVYALLSKQDTALKHQATYEAGSIYSNYASYGNAVDMFRKVPESSAYGEGAKSYLEALEPIVKPVSVYISTDWFYETNPDSVSSSTIQSGTTSAQGSNGITAIVKLDSMKWEPSEKWRFHLAYLYYGVFYGQDFAKANDFVGHFLNPTAHFQMSPASSVSLQLDLQKFEFGGQSLSDNQGATLRFDQRLDGSSWYTSISSINKAHNEVYESGGVTTSLAYLDGNNLTAKLGGTLTLGSQSLSGSYTYTDTATENNQTTTLHLKALDSVNIRHGIALSDNITIDDAWSVALHGSYSQATYSNKQTGNAFPSVTGQSLDADTKVFGFRVNYVPKFIPSMTFGIGAEQTKNTSNATELANENDHYSLEISGSF